MRYSKAKEDIDNEKGTFLSKVTGKSDTGMYLNKKVVNNLTI